MRTRVRRMEESNPLVGAGADKAVGAPLDGPGRPGPPFDDRRAPGANLRAEGNLRPAPRGCPGVHDKAAPEALPYVDEHARAVAATPGRAWAALVDVLPRAFGGSRAERFARLVGCDAAAADGAFPREGAALVGFRVARAEAPRELALAGRHRFSQYALTFRLDPVDGGLATRLRAETRAAFPGAAGAAYRAAVIGTGGHAVVVRRLLRGVARRAERVQ